MAVHAYLRIRVIIILVFIFQFLNVYLIILGFTSPEYLGQYPPWHRIPDPSENPDREPTSSFPGSILATPNSMLVHRLN